MSDDRSPLERVPELTGDIEIDIFLKSCLDTMKRKGVDYTQGNTDRLHNFRTVAATVDLTMQQVWSVYFYKHYSALMSFIKRGQTESEPIEERIKDMIVYLLLFYKIVKEIKALKDLEDFVSSPFPKKYETPNSISDIMVSSEGSS